MGFLSSIRVWLIKNKQEKSLRKSNTKVKKMEATGDNHSTTSATLSSNVTSANTYKASHKFEAGRRFLDIENISYFFPNDNDEVDRLHQQHFIVRNIMGGNFQSPVNELLDKGIIVLDSGCGPATWCLDMSEKFPNSTFYGVDAYPVFPSEVKPKNCHFQLGNVADRLPYPDNYFDFIHQRLLIFGLTRSDWRNAIKEHIRVLKPGGYLEILECDIEFVNEGPKTHRVMDSVFRAFARKDMSPAIARELGPDYLEPTDQFEDLQDRTVTFPMNHGGKLGELFWEDYRQGCEALHAWIYKEDSAFEDLEVYKSFLEECGAECKEYTTNMIWHCYTVKKKAD